MVQNDKISLSDLAPQGEGKGCVNAARRGVRIAEASVT